MRIGIIGGSVAGSYAAAHLASQGHETVIYERRPDREKPCGGGLTEKAFLACPDLAESNIPNRVVTGMKVISSRGTEAYTKVDRPFRIYSRQALHGALREQAAQAGAAFRFEQVHSLEEKPSGWAINNADEFDFLIGAGGYADPLMRQKLGLFTLEQTAAMIGYFLPGDFGSEVVIRMLGWHPGYIWVFPRRDHASVGLMVGAPDMEKTAAYEVLDRFIARYYPEYDMSKAQRYGAPAPMIMQSGDHAKRKACGKNWALIGDAAGLCDPLTGEGLYYALVSAKELAVALDEGDLGRYQHFVSGELIPELLKAASLKKKFFRRWFWEAAMFMMRRSPACAAIARDFIAGSQEYKTLKPRTFKEMPRMILQAMTPGGGSNQP